MKYSIFLLLLLLPACTFFTKVGNFYYKYINPNPSVSLDNKKLINKPDYHFSQAIMPVDEPLTALLESMSAKDHITNKENLKEFLIRFSWLKSMGIFGSTGQLLEQIGEPIQVDSAALLAIENLDERRLRLVQDKQGNFLLLYPLYKDNVWIGLKAAVFSPQKLMQQSPQATQLALFFNNQPLFCGESFLYPQKIQEKLKNDDTIFSCFKKDNRHYCWLRRHLGDRWIVYAFIQNEQNTP